MSILPVFDTSVLVPLFIKEHEHHKKAKHLFATADWIILHPSVITEFTTVIRRLAKNKGLDGNEQAREALLSLLLQPRVSIRSDMDYQEIIDLYASSSRLSFTDAMVAQSDAYFDKKAPATLDESCEIAHTISKEERKRRRKDIESRISVH